MQKKRDIIPKTYTQEQLAEITKQVVGSAIKEVCEHYEKKIRLLEADNRKLKNRIAILETPAKRGRPPKKKLSNFLGKSDCLGVNLSATAAKKRRGGAPVKYSNINGKLLQWDEAKKNFPKTGKKEIPDLDLVNHIISNDRTGMAVWKRNELRKELMAIIKYMRDQERRKSKGVKPPSK